MRHSETAWLALGVGVGVYEALAPKDELLSDQTTRWRQKRLGRLAVHGLLVCWCVAGWSSSVARWAHNPEVRGSNPRPATDKSWPRCFPRIRRGFSDRPLHTLLAGRVVSRSLYRILAYRAGIEPASAVLETAVLPLHHRHEPGVAQLHHTISTLRADTG